MIKIEIIILSLINILLILFEMGTLKICIGYLKTASFYYEIFTLLKSMCLTGIILSIFTLVNLIRRK